jgi:hypothetical protein
MKLGEAHCAGRIGVARLAKMSFDGVDLRPVWRDLIGQLQTGADDAGIGMDLSVIAQFLGDAQTGLALQADVLGRQRLFRSPCAVKSPGLRVLALAAQLQVGGNTPIEFLLEDSDVELTIFYVVPGAPPPEALPEHDVAIVIAPHVDGGNAPLAEIERLAAAWPRKVLNAPANIRVLDRARLHRALASVQGLDIPVTIRIPRAELAEMNEADAQLRLGDGGFPLIVRPTGSHAGRGLAKLECAAHIGAYLQDRSEADFFISRFVDYSSADGLFRKYRIVCIDGAPYACHMAISDAWDIWYLNAEMGADTSKKNEEARFMATFDHDFAARHGDAFAEMGRRIGLDYFLIDCAETKSGDLLLFEADNTAIAHNMDPADIFPYKPPQMRKVFAAFVTMLYRHADLARACAA